MARDFFSMGVGDIMGGDEGGDEGAGDQITLGDIMGGAFFSGDEGGDEGGEDVGSAAAQSAAAKKWMRIAKKHGWTPPGRTPQGYSPRTVQYKPFQGSRERVQPIGLSRFIPAATPTLEATNNPQFPFRVERLTVPSTLAPNFIINDFKVGNIPQFNASGPISAVTFSEQGVGVRLAGDTCYIGQAMTINVTNISGADATFYATVIGTTITRLGRAGP